MVTKSTSWCGPGPNINAQKWSSQFLLLCSQLEGRHFWGLFFFLSLVSHGMLGKKTSKPSSFVPTKTLRTLAKSWSRSKIHRFRSSIGARQLQPIPLEVTFSKVQRSKVERLFCHVSVKRDIRALNFEVWNSIRKCHPKYLEVGSAVFPVVRGPHLRHMEEQTSNLHIGQIVNRCYACVHVRAVLVSGCECNKSENVCKDIISAFVYGCVPYTSHSHTRMLVSVSFYSSTSPLHTGPRRALSTAILKFVWSFSVPSWIWHSKGGIKTWKEI